MPSFRRLLWLILSIRPLVLCDTASVTLLRDRKPFVSLSPSANQKDHAKQSLISLIDRLGRATKQIGVHIACAPVPFGITPRILCLSGAACYAAGRYSYNRSEAAQRACYFWKRAGPIVAHYKFTQWWLAATKAPLEKRHDVYKSLHDRYCEPSLDIILNLKGLYVKVGQVMSSRSDFMPVQYIELFSTVEDALPQWPIEEVIAIVRDSLRSELGLDYEEVFASIDPIAVGSASIGQVHRAVLADNWVKADPGYTGGKTVALKVMHPDAKQRFTCDFQVFRWLLRVAMSGWTPLLDELEKRLMTEFDYHNEANSLSLVRENLLRSPYRKQVRVPQPYKSLCSSHILVMEMLQGKKLTDAIEDNISTLLGGDDERAHEILAQKQREALFGEVNEPAKEASLVELFNLHGLGGMYRAMKGIALYRRMNKYVDLLLDVHGHQIFQDGVFNADPHAGNIMELSDGRLGLIDFGQTRILTDEERLGIARVVADLGSGADNHKVAESMRLAGFRTQLDRDDTLAQYADLFFDSDHKCREKGYATPQHYFAGLMETDALVVVPDAAILVARASLLFRGAGTILNRQVQTSQNWQHHARQALVDTSNRR